MGALNYLAWAGRVRRLAAAVDELDGECAGLGLGSIREAGWHENLVHKLLPQLVEDPFLIVAVTGGTNTGKSTDFNHLVGGRASRVHQDASRTRHAVCTIPRGFHGRQDLGKAFPGFRLRPWTSAEDALAEGPDNLLIYREDPDGGQPDRLLLLDTPDVDGALEVNWARARLIRQAADVLVCILTAQKSNDDAIRRFFREAGEAESDKTSLVVFNLIEWPEAREYCLVWLDTFRRGTGVAPAHASAASRDRAAAAALRLPFHPLGAGSTDPRRDLAEPRFDEIKVRSLRIALHVVLDDRGGVPAQLRRIRERAAE